MSHVMKALGVNSVDEWAVLAWQRPADPDEHATAKRRDVSDRMLAILLHTGFVADEAYNSDIELLVSGRMSHDEHRAYLAEKYKESQA